MSDNFNELESLRDTNLELQEQNTNLTTERDTLSQDNEKLKAEVERLRTINQKYYNKLIAQDETKDKADSDDQEEEAVPTCEEFAKTIKII